MKLAFWQTHTDGDKYGFSRKKEISRLAACLRGQTAIGMSMYYLFAARDGDNEEIIIMTK
jgi:hypothetical protein